MQSRVLTRGLGPGCVGLEDIFSVDVSLKVIPELLISTLACTSFLDTAFEGVVLVATFNPGLDRAAAGETVELDGNIGFEILVNFLVAIVGPDSLRRYQLEGGSLSKDWSRTNQLETITIVHPCDDMTSNGCEQGPVLLNIIQFVGIEWINPIQASS